MDPYQASYQPTGYPMGSMPMIKPEPMDYPPPYPMNYMNSGYPMVPYTPQQEPPPPKVKKRKSKQDKVTDHFKEKKPRKKIDRFKGMSEEEVAKRTLPDHLQDNLDIVIIGINPGLMAAFKGHHYAGPGNHFWKCLYLSGMSSEPLTAMDDFKLLDMGIGFTNMVNRTTRGSADLTRKEIKEGAKVMIEKIKKYKPLIACFNGKGIYEIFSGKKDFEVGRQPETIPGTNTVIFVMPSSSARCSQFPRAQDKVHFYVSLKKLRDELKGIPPAPEPSAPLPAISNSQSMPPVATNQSQPSVPAESQPSSITLVKIKQEKVDEDRSSALSNCQSITSIRDGSLQTVKVESPPPEKDYITLQPMNPMSSGSFMSNSIAGFSGDFQVKQEPVGNPEFQCSQNNFMPPIKQEMGFQQCSPLMGLPGEQWSSMGFGNFMDQIPPIASNTAVPVTDVEQPDTMYNGTGGQMF